MINQGLINAEFIFNVVMVYHKLIFFSTGCCINCKNKKIHDLGAEDGLQQK